MIPHRRLPVRPPPVIGFHSSELERQSRRNGHFSVLVADDHAVVRAGYRKFLGMHPAVREVGEAESGDQTLEKLRAAVWHVLLLDISMPDRGGLDILHRVQASYPQLRVIVISGLPESQYAPGVLKAGAFGYLPKELAGPELLKALDLVFSGRKYVSPTLAEYLAGNLAGPHETSLHEELSAKAFQVFLKLAYGRDVADIASELKLSRKTVSTYRTSVLRALNCATTADVTRYALNQNLIQ